MCLCCCLQEYSNYTVLPNPTSSGYYSQASGVGLGVNATDDKYIVTLSDSNTTIPYAYAGLEYTIWVTGFDDFSNKQVGVNTSFRLHPGEELSNFQLTCDVKLHSGSVLSWCNGVC